MANIITRRAAARTKYADQFRRVFGVKLADYYPNHIEGLDVVKLDRLIKPGKKTLQQAIIEKYGNEAWKMVESLT